MSRGQYTPRKSRIDPNLPEYARINLARELADADALKSYPPRITDKFGQPVTQEQFDALEHKADRLLRLCQTHGLMIDG